MANFDSANGFTPIGGPAQTNTYNAGGTFAKGDLLTFDGSGKVILFVAGTHDEACGVAAQAGSSGNEAIVYDHPDTEYRAQCSGTYAATQDGGLVAVEGATGAMEVDENGTSGIMVLLGHSPITGALSVGANARVRCKIARHAMGSGNADAAAVFEGMTLPSLSAAAESGNVIAVTVQLQDVNGNSVASAKDLEIRLLDDNGDAPNPASAQKISKTSGDGATWVTAESKDSAIITTAADGSASIDVTDVSTASTDTFQLVVTALSGLGMASRVAVTFA